MGTCAKSSRFEDRLMHVNIEINQEVRQYTLFCIISSFKIFLFTYWPKPEDVFKSLTQTHFCKNYSNFYSIQYINMRQITYQNLDLPLLLPQGYS